MNRTFWFIAFFCFLGLALGDQRRIGKRHDLTWSSYYELGTNENMYQSSEYYPDLSIVGALISNSGALGTATLIAPNYVVTAAHVVKNDYYETPNESNWEFVMYDNFGDASSLHKFQIDQIIIHPAWSARQTASNALGDGDELGVDLAIVRLNRSVVGAYPARLPSANDDPLGERTVLAGYGTLVEGNTGDQNNSNDRRLGGENTIDRSVAQVFKAGVPESQRGGVLGIDFDSPQQSHNSLVSGTSIDLLGSGSSQADPLALEASTAVGDSGGPAFCRTNNSWRIHGVVSYGTDDSTYGDVTIYTRLASHYDWLLKELPNWSDSKLLDESGWIQNPWMGTLVPVSNNWIYHLNLGWIYIPTPKGNYFWGWSHHLGKWVWLSDQAFPFIYCYSSEGSFWMYVLLESSSGSTVRAYDYSSNSWQSYP